MDKEQVIHGVIDYYKSDQWRRLMAALLQDPDPQRTHAHVFVETCVNPGVLQSIMEGYFSRMGIRIGRRITMMSPKPGMGSLHGIEPKGLPHFDWNWFFNPEVALAGTQGGDKGESGSNLVIWNTSYYLREFYGDFRFRDITPREEDEVRTFFASDYWHNGLSACTQPSTNHGHINCCTSVHPDALQRLAEESLRTKGWEIYYTCPNVYLVDGKYTGKLVFMGKHPETVYDLGWRFKADVVIEPATEPWFFRDQIGYDLWTTHMLRKMLELPYVQLTDTDVRRVLDTIAPTGPAELPRRGDPLV